MKTTKKPPRPGARKIGRPPKPADAIERQMVGTRLHPALYQKLVEAAAANGRSITAEMEKRIAESFDRVAMGPEDLRIFAREIMSAFEAGGRRESRRLSKHGELSAAEWMKDANCFTSAANSLLGMLAQWHPRPLYAQCLAMIWTFRAHLDREWHTLVNLEEDKEEHRKMIEQADLVARHTMTRPPSLLDNIPEGPTDDTDDPTPSLRAPGAGKTF